MVYIYIKTSDNIKHVKQTLCRTIYVNINNGQWKANEVEDNCLAETRKGQPLTAVIYRCGNEVICIEVDESCAAKIIEALMQNYGFGNIKWLLTT